MASLKEAVTNGSLLQEKSSEKISLDYTYTLGQIEGMNTVIEMIKDAPSYLEEDNKGENK